MTEQHDYTGRLRPAWWTAILLAAIVAWLVIASVMFSGTFRRFVPVTLVSERSGLVMEPKSKVRMRGLEVGQVDTVRVNGDSVRLTLQMYPDQIKDIPANVDVQIRATTVFGAKYVDLIYPEHPSADTLSAGAVLHSRNVSTEVNTIFENLVNVITKIDPAKLNATLEALATGVRGQGHNIGEATTATNQVLLQLNPRMDTVAGNFRSLKGFADTYSAAVQDILATIDAATTTSATIVDQAHDLDALLLNLIGLGRTGTDVLAANGDDLANAVNTLRPTTALLHEYNPIITCTLVGATTWLDTGALDALGGNGKSLIIDGGLMFGSDPYRYPDNLPIIAAKGGPGGKPDCGSLPDVTKKFPVRQLVTNTGFGTGLDYRPNPGIGFPGWANYFPVTRAVPEPPSIRYYGGPAPGPFTPPPPAPPPPAPPPPAPPPQSGAP